MLGCIVAGGGYWLSRPNHINKAEFPVLPAGWDELAPCSALESLDEMKEMTLSDDQRAESQDLSPPEDGEDPKSRNIEGAWSYDAGSKRYAITLNGQTTTYTLLARGDPTTCILLKGGPHAVDLSASWFSFSSKNEPPDYDPDYRPERQVIGEITYQGDSPFRVTPARPSIARVSGLGVVMTVYAGVPGMGKGQPRLKFKFP